MGKSNRALTLALASCLAITLSACGGSDSTPTPLSSTDNGTTPTTGSPGSGTGSTITTDPGRTGPNEAHAIVITTAVSDVIENMAGEGIYRRRYSAVVTDLEGHAVADGTPVYLNAIDSIMARGTLSTTRGNITGSVLTDTSRAGADDIDDINFDSAYVIRNETHHFIHEGSHLLLPENSHAEDKVRKIGSTAAQNQTVTVSKSYTSTYPHPHPDLSDLAYDDSKYIIGESLIGITAGGIDTDGQYTPGLAYTDEGIATFYVTYPANSQTANIGCTNPILPLVDNRYEPADSAQPYVFAYVSDSVSAIERTCFYAIDGGELVAQPSKLPTTGTITVALTDGGDGFRLPFVNVGAYIELDDASADITFDTTGTTTGYYTTNGSGVLIATVTVTAGKGSVVFTYGEAEVKVTVGN